MPRASFIHRHDNIAFRVKAGLHREFALAVDARHRLQAVDESGLAQKFPPSQTDTAVIPSANAMLSFLN